MPNENSFKLTDNQEEELKDLDRNALNTKLELANLVVQFEMHKTSFLQNIFDLNKKFNERVTEIAKENSLSPQEWGFDVNQMAFFNLEKKD